jgi:MFS family permease
MGVPLVHLASFVGMICGSPTIGATSLLVAMLFGAVGRICFGLVADRIGYLPSYALASAIQTVCVAAYPLVSGNVSLLALSALFGFGFAGNMTCLILCVREAAPAHRFGGALGMVMLAAWAGMGTGGYAGGALFDIYASYIMSFTLAGVAGLLNLSAIATLIVVRRAVCHQTQGATAVAAT